MQHQANSVTLVMDTPFIPNDVSFAQDGLRAMVITGCNMSGKSSFSRMVALLVIMAQIGCHLPCESAKIGIVDYVGTRFGASDEIQRGRSVSHTWAAHPFQRTELYYRHSWLNWPRPARSSRPLRPAR